MCTTAQKLSATYAADLAALDHNDPDAWLRGLNAAEPHAQAIRTHTATCDVCRKESAMFTARYLKRKGGEMK